MKLAILSICALIGFLQASTTHKPREPNEYESLAFFYSRESHNLMMKKIGRMHTDCYVQSLSDQQIKQVHTDNGLKTLELNMLGNTGSFNQVSASMLSDTDSTWCLHGIHNRTITYYFM